MLYACINIAIATILIVSVATKIQTVFMVIIRHQNLEEQANLEGEMFVFEAL